jgi:penicillin-binding protein 1C
MVIMDQTTPTYPASSVFGEMMQVTPPPLSPWRKFVQALSKSRDRLVEQAKNADQAILQFSDGPKVVTIGRMEIDITWLVELLMAPYNLVRSLFGGQARSRRGRLSETDQQLKQIKLVRSLAILGLAGVVIGIVVFFGMFAWFSRDLPKPGQVVRRDGFSTKLHDRNGELLYDLFDSERRNPITIGQVPEQLKQATIAVEDKDFYKHKGFDVLTIVRIPYNMIFRQRVVGGSTLTQQLVKNVLLTNERTITRKFKEFVLALQIERTFTKDQILEMYLNEAPYGGTAWGVGAAAEIYFNKPVSDLTLVESAILAGLPQRPSAYSPFAGKTDETGELLWKIRAKGVLRRMADDGYITELAHQEALAQLDTIQFSNGAVSVKAPHFVFYVRDQLEELFGEDIVERGGLKVTTSLDLELQEKAQQIVADEIEAVKDFNITNGAAMVMDPRTGEILSMVGSRDYFSQEIDGQFNVAVDGLRQPGSSIKPVTYLAMFERGFHPGSMLADVATTFVANEQTDKPYEPKNYDGKFRGPVSLRDSLGSSLNITAVKSLAIVGVDNFLSQAYSMGFETLEPTQENMKRFGLAVTLGGAEVHLIDTVSAYSSFANGGTKVEPVSILKVEDIDGSVLYENRPVEGPRVMSEEGAFLVNHVLSDNNARLMAFGANSLLNTGKPIAVKTGTTNDQRDNWTIGWSQEIIVGTWVGNNDNSPMTRVASGITGASPIWRKIINAALEKGYKTPEWVVPEGVEKVLVDRISGYPEHDGYPSREEYVVKGTLPALPDPIHSKLKLCRGENKLANEARVATGDYDEKEFVVLREDDPVSQDGRNRWQEGIQNWINGQENGLYKVPTEYCGEESELFITLRQPSNETKYNEQDLEVEVEAGSGSGIEKIEIIVNGSVKKTVDGSRFKEKMNFPSGRYEVWAKAYSRDGKQRESSKSKIGTGGQDWRAPDPSPSPSPSPSPNNNGNGGGNGNQPSPTPSPSPSPVVSPSPSPSP